MWAQIATVAWAQFRAARNHLPRTTFGSLLGFAIASIWYGGFGALAIFIAVSLPLTPLPTIKAWLSSWLLGVFLFWQVVPLATLSGGWSLDRRKLQIYPISDRTLLLTEALLRITASFEMLLVLLGICAGLLHCRDLVPGAPLLLLLFIPFNLLLGLAIRDLALRLFRRNKLRELFTVLVVTLAVLPDLLLRSGANTKVKPVFLVLARGTYAPWQNMASAALGNHLGLNLCLGCAWLCVVYLLAQQQFAYVLREEEPLRLTTASVTERPSRSSRVTEWLNRALADPVAALVVKEIRTLVRMPRFRVVFTLATFFAVLVLIPTGLGQDRHSFFGRNFLPVMNVYGLLVLGDALLWNIFGFDRSAAQTYYVAPVPLDLVFRAKNLAAIVFMTMQTCIVIAFAVILRLPVSFPSILTSLLAAAVMGTCFLAVGNLSSVIVPRPIDPRTTMRKQAGATIQLWLLGCSIGGVVLIGSALLAGWALNTPWAAVGVLCVEFGIALLTYRIATESAVKRGISNREEITAALSRGSSLVSG